jgi:hypothetical protein
MIHPIICPMRLVVIAQEWPYWLAPALALKLPLAAVFIAKEMQSLFSVREYVALANLDDLWEAPLAWNRCTILASGLHKYLSFVMTKLRSHDGPFIYATDTVFKGHCSWGLNCLLNSWSTLCLQQGLVSSTVRHTNFGGVTSAVHLMSYRGVDQSAFRPQQALPLVLAHILNAATLDASRDIVPPGPLNEPTPRSPIVVDGMLRQEGLFDVFSPLLPLACPCVFKASGWAQRTLLAKELLRAFDMDMDATLLMDQQARIIFQCSVTPIVVSAIFHLLWTSNGGVKRLAGRKISRCRHQTRQK